MPQLRGNEPILYQCLSACIFLRFLIFFSSLQVHPSLILLSQLCIFALRFFCTLCSSSSLDSMDYASSVYFSSCPQHAISPCVIPLHINPHLFFVPHSYSLCAPSACHMRNASACSSCRVLCLIIIETLQRLWLLNPCVHHH
jgi:hypothetical protein